jgi:hypothetical protein
MVFGASSKHNAFDFASPTGQKVNFDVDMEEAPPFMRLNIPSASAASGRTAGFSAPKPIWVPDSTDVKMSKGRATAGGVSRTRKKKAILSKSTLASSMEADDMSATEELESAEKDGVQGDPTTRYEEPQPSDKPNEEQDPREKRLLEQIHKTVRALDSLYKTWGAQYGLKDTQFGLHLGQKQTDDMALYVLKRRHPLPSPTQKGHLA